MTALDWSVPDITGTPPTLDGKTCTGLICEQFWHQGQMASPANVIFIRADETWYRLVLDSGVIHWREQPSQPEPWEAREEGWTYPHFDLARHEHLAGLTFSGCVMQASESGCSVELSFSDCRRIVFQEASDIVTYAVI